MIYINNDTDCNLDRFTDIVQEACEKTIGSVAGAPASEIGVTFVSDDAIRKMNQSYRGIGRVTDVLSFPADTGPDGVMYGDIFICFGQAVRQAMEIGNTNEREIAFLVVHGTLHLLGYDHTDEKSEYVMINKQKEIMKNLP